AAGDGAEVRAGARGAAPRDRRGGAPGLLRAGLMRWAGFESAAGALGTQARARLEQHGFVLLGTVRRDGTPRISPVEVHLVGGELMLALIAGSLKARDVE